jgi:hypothetical protein
LVDEFSLPVNAAIAEQSVGLLLRGDGIVNELVPEDHEFVGYPGRIERINSATSGGETLGEKTYIGNLSFRAAEEELRAEFENLGVATKIVTVVRERPSGQSRGFGFVEIANDAELEKTIAALNRKDVMGRTIVVMEARPQTDGRYGGGGRDGGGRGDGGRRGRDY